MPVSTECAAALLSFRYPSNNNKAKWLALSSLQDCTSYSKPKSARKLSQFCCLLYITVLNVFFPHLKTKNSARYFICFNSRLLCKPAPVADKT